MIPANRPPHRSGPVLRCKTPRFTHHSLTFSPFFEQLLAVGSGANFGLVGNGRLHILEIAQGRVGVKKWFDTQDCVYDVAWSEEHENQVLAACGDGGLRLFDLTLEGLPIRIWHEHSAEVMSVDWNNLQKDTFCTASWDHSVKIWTTGRQTSLFTIPAHQAQVYSATWSPHTPSMLATCGADGLLKIFDLRTGSPANPMQVFKASPTEVLCCDWNKYDISTIVTASKDNALRIWDMRSGRAECAVDFKGHTMAVRKAQWSPHHRDVLASSGYDMTCRVWNRNSPAARLIHTDHTEFVMGLGWALFDPGLLGSCAWDEEVHLYRA